MALTAKALLDFASREQRSGPERRWSSEGPLLMKDLFLTHVELTHYEPLTFSIPGGRYTPDYMHVLSTGELVFVEVKASRRQKNYRDARSKLRAAAEIYPIFHWVEAIAPSKVNPAWKLEQIGVANQSHEQVRKGQKAVLSNADAR